MVMFHVKQLQVFRAIQPGAKLHQARLFGASDAVLIGGAQPPEINASDLTATPYDPEEAFTDAGSFSS